MAKYRHISISSVTTLLLLTTSSPFITVAEGDGGGGSSEWVDDDSANFVENTPITWKYGLMWTKSSLKAPRYDYSNFNDDIESVNCTSDANCTAALPGVEVALQYPSNLPSSPYCVMPDDVSNATTPEYVTNKCTCGEGRCVSYSRESSTDNPFYYCGPCGHAGSKCTYRCTHELTECRGGYCECIQEGTFYDMTYCYIPFYGQEILINILIATSILLLCCATLAYGYHKLGNRRLRRASIYNDRGSGTGRRESPSDDTPPAYDDVMEKLPSYQDAIKMFEKVDDERGLNNPAFEADEFGIQESKANQEPTTTAVATLQGDVEKQSSSVFEKDKASPPRYQDATSTTQTISQASSPLNNVHTGNSLPSSEDIASFPESSAREGRYSEVPVKNKQQELGTQPIELLLHDALHTQHTTTSL